jgi:hypothetical protein
MAMNNLLPRRIFKSAITSKTEVKELLLGIFTGELLAPSRCLWVVSPWLSDINIVDNNTGAFLGLELDWGRRPIPLLEILGRLLALGTTLVVATRPVDHNKRFIGRLKELASYGNVEQRLIVKFKDVLHLKGILGDLYYMDGSMNFTHNGVEILEEGINFDLNRETIALTRLTFLENYGGV